MSGFSFNGISSKSNYITAIKTERVLVAKRKHTTIIMPESDTVILIPDNSREPISLVVECLVEMPSNKTVFDVGRELDSWLSQEDWQRLIFDDDPNYYYEAICMSEIRVSDLRDPNKNTITIEFLCNPQMKKV